MEGGEALKTKAGIERTKFDSHISGIVENSQSALKVGTIMLFCYNTEYFSFLLLIH